jgi:hypothetical protein
MKEGAQSEGANQPARGGEGEGFEAEAPPRSEAESRPTSTCPSPALSASTHC